jgi:CRP-like cAMP-binding protein
VVWRCKVILKHGGAPNCGSSIRAAATSLLGLPGIVGSEPYTLAATARKGSEVKFVTRGAFEDLMRAEPSLSFNVLQVIATEVRAAR